MQQTLVLTATYQPHKIVSWQKAVTMIFLGKVEVLEEYDEEIRSVSITIRMPAVVRLLRVLRGKGRGLKFSRINVMTRDHFRCQYCGEKHAMRELTYDHVVPRSQGGRTTWENIVTACYECNRKKSGRTPQQAGMKLRAVPVKPKTLPTVTLRFDLGSMPDAWASWVYWQGALDEG